MNLNHLAIFHAVALTGNISRGAERLHICQSAVSKQLGEFERTLGHRLFDRLPRGVRLTQAGSVLAAYARKLFELEQEAEQALGDLQKLDRGSLAIGASRTISSYLLPARMAAFHARYPGVELSLHENNTLSIERKLLDREIDVGFTEGVVRDDLLSYSAFAQDELVLIAKPTHPAAKRGALSAAELSSFSILMHEPGSGTRDVTERALADKKLRIRPAMTLASSEAIKQTVCAGGGLAFLSSLSITEELKRKKLVVIQVKQLRIRRPLYQVTLKASAPSPALSAFLASD